MVGTLFLLTGLACSGRMVPRDKLKEFNDKYGGDKVYTLKKDVDVGNGEIVRAGTKVRIWFSSNSFSVKVKSYPFLKSRERATGRNLIYLHEGDFKNEEFEKEKFFKLFHEILEEDAGAGKKKEEK